MPTLDKAGIAALIPHGGAMCLIDRVTGWIDCAIDCETMTHRDAANPLRSRGVLPITAGIEYAAQAMAIHGGLTQMADLGPPKAGYLASLRNLRLGANRLDDFADALTIHAEQLLGEEGRVIYEFRINAASRLLLHGRAAVVLEAAP